jgi:glycosyltransferase involved in cell wall biosynthesis
MIKVLGLSLYGPLAASTRYRLTQYIEPLREQGIALEVHPLLGDDYVQTTYAGQPYPKHKVAAGYARRLGLLATQSRYDLAIIQAEMFPLLPGFIESRLLRIPYIYDFDDAFFLKYTLERFRTLSFLLHDKFDPVLAKAGATTPGNAYLQQQALRFNANSPILPTVVDTERYQVAHRQDPDVFTVGWVGSPSTSVYLSMMVDPLARLAREGPVRFLVVGGVAPDIPGVDVRELPWSEAAEVDLINTFDVGVMPLFDDEWARGKCAFKLIQYMACGVPVVASGIGTNVDVVTSDCGFLADTPDQWVKALQSLRGSRDMRAHMGVASRARVEAGYSLHSATPVLAGVIRQLAQQR